jgi:hypothetical protein
MDDLAFLEYLASHTFHNKALFDIFSPVSIPTETSRSAQKNIYFKNEVKTDYLAHEQTVVQISS